MESPLTGSCFGLLIQIKKTFFFFSKRALFNEAFDPQMLYLSKIGPEEFNVMSFIYKKLENMLGGANNKGTNICRIRNKHLSNKYRNFI